MSAGAFLKILTVWLWLNLLGAGFILFESGPRERFWFLLMAAAASWVSLQLFNRHFADRRR